MKTQTHSFFRTCHALISGRITATRIGLILLSVSLPATLIFAQETSSEKPDQERIQGTWECVATVKDGEQVDDFLGVRAVMVGTELIWMFPNPDGSYKTGHARFTLDTSQNPKHFDWYMPDSPEAIHRRYYVLTDDVLIWSTDLGVGPRPESFMDGSALFVMKRMPAE